MWCVTVWLKIYLRHMKNRKSDIALTFILMVSLAFHSALFSPDHQPEESGSSDLTNEQLAALATSSGASAAAGQCVSSGQNVAAAEASATASSATLNAATGQVATPTVLRNGAPVSLSVNWLGDLLGQS